MSDSRLDQLRAGRGLIRKPGRSGREVQPAPAGEPYFDDARFDDLPLATSSLAREARMGPTLGRFFLYALGLGAAFAAAFESVRFFGIAPFIREGGVLEQAQVVLLLVSAGLIAFLSRRQSRSLLLVAAALPLLGVTRELDGLFDVLLYHGSWTIPFYLLLTATVVFALRHRRELVNDFPTLAETRAFGIFFAGFLVVALVSRLMGRQAVWEAALGEAYVRDIPRLVEETLELAGYLIFLLGAIELYFSQPRAERARTSSRSEWPSGAPSTSGL